MVFGDEQYGSKMTEKQTDRHVGDQHEPTTLALTVVSSVLHKQCAAYWRLQRLQRSTHLEIQRTQADDQGRLMPHKQKPMPLSSSLFFSPTFA